MTTRKYLTLVALAIGLATPTVASASSSANSNPCVFKEHRVASVTPYRVQKQIGKISVARLRGAQLYVRAEPGLTAEWLRARLGEHLAAMQTTTMPDCALDVADVSIEVHSAGAGFTVRLIAKDADDAAEVLRRARLLLG